MQRILSGLLALVMLLACGCASAQGTAYESRIEFYDDDDLIRFATSAGGTLYTLRDSGLYAVAPDGTETCAAQAEALSHEIHALVSDGQSLYGLVFDDTLSLLELVDESGNFVQRLLLATDAYRGSYLQNPVVRDGKLYFLHTDGAEASIIIHTLATGESISLRLTGIRCFDVMPDGRLLAFKQETRWPQVSSSLVTIAPETGKTALWAKADTDQNLRTLIYDSAADTAYLFGRSDVFAGREGGEIARIDGFIGGDVISAALLPSGAALVVDDSLVIRNFATASGGQARRLTILEMYGRGGMYRSFLQENPNVDVQFASPGNQSGEERFVQDMVTRSADIDVYILSDTNLLRSIKEKGYFVDMGQNPEIQGLVGQMYAPFRRALTLGEQIVAFPREAFFEMICYHKPTFDALGLPPPDTYDAYFDFCLAWLGTYADTYPDVVLNPFANDLTLETLLMRYADERARGGEPVQFHTETMVRVMEKYQQLRKAMADQGSPTHSGTPLFYNYFIPILDEESEYAYLPLTFEKDAQAAVGPREGDFSYFVANPYGKNPQDALAFIAAFDENRVEAGTALLYESVNSAMESKAYKSHHALLQKELDALQAQHAAAEPDMRKALETQISAQKEAIQAHERTNRWAISQGAITLYKAYADCLYINDFNPLPSLREGDRNLFQEQESLNAPSFLAALDSRAGMMLSEEGMR